MNRLQLPNVTLIALTGLGYKTEEHVEALRKSCEGIEFGAVKLVQLAEIVDVDTWNRAVIYELPKYVETAHCLFVHHDGYVIHPELWKEEWLDYDFIGAPWPLPTDDYSYRTPSGKLVRVGNSVGLRSKKLLDLVATRPMEYHYGNNNEDGQVCVWEREWLESQGCNFAPLEVAVHFSKEHDMPENNDIETFIFHELG